MITPDTLVALKPFGILGLIIVAIVAVVSLAALIQKARPQQSVLIFLVLAAAIGAILIAGFAFKPSSFWTNVGVVADWGGEDEDCVPNVAPENDHCDDERVGRIALCWDVRNEGWPEHAAGDRCRNNKTWCTYKNGRIRIGVPANGQAPPGRVYVCARGLVH